MKRTQMDSLFLSANGQTLKLVNISLSNIEVFDEIPYMFYYTNKVNMVISTDGHGMYGTDTQFEDEIARTYMGDKAYKDGIVDFDREVLKSKGGR